MGGKFCSWVYLSVCANFGSGYTFILPTGTAMLHKNFPGQIRDTLTELLMLDDRPKLAEILAQRNQDGHIETLNLTGITRYSTQRGTQGVLIMLKYARNCLT